MLSCSLPSSTATAKEREIYRYYDLTEFTCASGDESGTKRSSNDPSLTAFAQLGALRLNARRGIIILSTGDAEYILAESGQILSLQEDDNEDDKLWLGVGLRKREGNTMGEAISKIFADPKNCPPYACVGDMTKDDRFKDKKIVVGPPHLRAMVCVPLKSSVHGMVIGWYGVLDDKVRSPLNESELHFLMDMATTVTDHLEAARIKKVQYRAERMVKAIGLFIEGKSTLRDWWLEKGHKSQHATAKKRSKKVTPLERQADMEFGVQETVDYFSRNGLHGLQNGDYRAAIATSPGSTSPSQSGTEPRSSRTPSHSGFEPVDGKPVFGDGRPGLPNRDIFLSISDTATPTTFASRSWQERNSSVTTFDETLTEPTPDPEKHPSVSFDLPPEPAQQENSHELQNALLNADIKGVFARASNLIREAIGVEGVVYFDASVGSFGGSSEKNVMEEKAPGAFHTDNANPENIVNTSEDDFARKSSDTDAEAKKLGHIEESEKYCNVLGFSTRRRSSLHGHRVSEELQRFPEAILRKLLKRYPHGKVFNFDEDGYASTSESDNTPSTNLDDAQPKPEPDPEIKARKRLSREQEAAALLSALPGARSVFWFPLWDQNRERWYSGSLIWSTTPSRTLCPLEDITYLVAFGNSTMAEISRLSAQALSKMKTDFISSISHELRSPLHGVLASVEFLQETEMTEQQIDMVDNIHASGKVLLDTINHVLDFSKVNRRSKNKKRIPKRLRKNKERRDSVDDSAEKADICIASEEVIESIYAGQKVSKKAFSTPGEHKRHNSTSDVDMPVSVIMDVPWRENWTFEIDKGAWRRILMNLFSNAMKYTASGFVKVSLHIEEDSNHHHKKRPHTYLVLKVKDSGKGIHEEFLKHQLFKPFSQEDNLSAGAGLGLSIVKAIVQEMGGKISFTSERETGTEATVKIPLVQSPLLKKREERQMVQEAREASNGKRVGLVGFDRYPDLTEEPTGILDREAEAAMLLKEMVKDTLKDWFGIDTTTVSPPDIVMIMEAGLGEKRLVDVLEEHGHGHGEEKRIAIILTSRYHSGPKADAHEHFRIFYVQQPYTPHKLAKVLHQAFCHSSGEAPEEHRTHSRTQSESVPPTPVPSTPVGLGHLSPTSETQDFASLVLKPEVIDAAPPLPKPRPQLWVPPSERVQEPAPAPTPTHPPESHLVRPHLEHMQQIPPAPDKPQATPETPPTPAAAKEEDKSSLRVLLVEDNEINLKLLIATMRKLKLDHATAMNGLEALNAYKDCLGKFDVIFMDISMPIMSGIESTRHIRRFEKENNLEPVALIALTGAANATTRQEAFSSGVDLFLTKPVPMKALRGMLDDLGREGRGVFAG